MPYFGDAAEGRFSMPCSVITATNPYKDKKDKNFHSPTYIAAQGLRADPKAPRKQRYLVLTQRPRTLATSPEQQAARAGRASTTSSQSGIRSALASQRRRSPASETKKRKLACRNLLRSYGCGRAPPVRRPRAAPPPPRPPCSPRAALGLCARLSEGACGRGPGGLRGACCGWHRRAGCAAPSGDGLLMVCCARDVGASCQQKGGVTGQDVTGQAGGPARAGRAPPRASRTARS